MSAPLLQLSNVAKSFGAVRALRGVSFELQAGEVHALVGENGAGKSTMIKIVTGAHQPDGGAVEIGGQVVERLNPAAAHALGISVIYQQPALFPDLTVAENIALTLEPPGSIRLVNWNERRARAVELLSRVGSKIEPETEARHLSMPQQQLVEIARALGAGAKVLIFDEPTASLTTREVDLLLGLVRNLRDQGVGIIYISHRLEEIFRVADRVTVLRDGQTVGTREVGKTGVPLTEAELIRMMVGREISTIFTPKHESPHPQPLSHPMGEGGRPDAAETDSQRDIGVRLGQTLGEVVLRLERIGCEAAGLQDINLEVRAGEIVGLSGLVGAGRTELARVLFGITPADDGEMLLSGKPVRIESPSDAIMAGIGYVPEDRRRHGVILEMAVAANITMAIQKSFFPGGWLRFGSERGLAQEFVRNLSIKTGSVDNPVATLSGGNQQKVAVARWLAAKPRVLILDEPTQGVDVGAKAEIHKLIRNLAAQGLAVLMISSELDEILGMCDRIAIMRRGRIAATLDARTADAHSVMAAAI
jgi:rhamnose transport system ATP-binding protein